MPTQTDQFDKQNYASKRTHITNTLTQSARRQDSHGPVSWTANDRVDCPVRSKRLLECCPATGNADFAGRSIDTQPGSSRSNSGICTTKDTSMNGIFTFATNNSCKKMIGSFDH